MRHPQEMPSARSVTLQVESFFLRKFKLGYSMERICMPSGRILGSQKRMVLALSIGGPLGFEGVSGADATGHSLVAKVSLEVGNTCGTRENRTPEGEALREVA